MKQPEDSKQIELSFASLEPLSEAPQVTKEKPVMAPDPIQEEPVVTPAASPATSALTPTPSITPSPSTSLTPTPPVMTSGSGKPAVSDMFGNWFLDYASYVILERAVPHCNDGLKPVQRRILHSMRELEDGRYNKVANIIGNTMKYHPHGDASIGDALVQLGQKDLLIDMQGNWGNILTGDSAAAPRYIEARLSKFALEVAFNPKTTFWQLSYDGRNKEPVTLPMKFPLVLAQGIEGIAVGLACKILPHNFLELIDASIDILNGKETNILPDFQTGGMADFSDYNRGMRGGRVRVRALIEPRTRNTLVVREIPFSTTTGSLIDSILSANDKGKIKVAKVEDNTAENVEILIHLPSGADAQQTIEALYVFTDCEVSVSPNACVINGDKPEFVGVDELLRRSTFDTKELLRRELEIQLGELQEKWHFASLERIFIEKRIYRDIEEAETWEEVIARIESGLAPYRKLFIREITRDDIVALTEIRIKRISKYNTFQADEFIRGLESQIEETRHHLAHLTDFAIRYFEGIRLRYGKGRARRTRIESFDRIVASEVALASETLYVDRKEGFAGFGMKKDEEVCKCSPIADIIVFLRNGKMLITRVSEKAFVGKDIIHIGVLDRDTQERTVFNIVYRDGKDGRSYAKRFKIDGFTRDREYDLTKGTDGSRVLYFADLPEDKCDVVTVYLKPAPRLRKTEFEFDFGSLAIKNRDAIGNMVSQHGVKNVSRKIRNTIDPTSQNPDSNAGEDVEPVSAPEEAPESNS
ncbi:MAG: DNA gyrase subunit A [Verrucomicrobia bacterium ADurb.Bin474]|nr:MAG: DNA gyrase subunit A [Verrucomicrobia bacterium ADurb.Bin474]